MVNTLLRDKVRLLRQRGKSLNYITIQLQVPKSTVRFWCKDIVLSKKQQKQLLKNMSLGGTLTAEKLRTKRILATSRLVEEGIREVGHLSPRELMLIGTALYWAEGYRKGNGEFGFTNSDPRMIRLILGWLTNCCSVAKNDIHVRVCINAIHKKRIKIIQDFWCKAVGLALSQFSMPTFIKVESKKKYLNPNEYYGTLRVKVRRSTDLRRKIMGRIEGISNYYIR